MAGYGINDSKKGLLSGILASGGKFKIEDFVAEIQGFILGLRLTHWKTTSYELHKAVEQTEQALEDLIDDFVEAYVGFVGGLRPNFKTDIRATTDEDSIITCLKGVELKDTSLLNIRDEMLQALYKFKYLKTLT